MQIRPKVFVGLFLILSISSGSHAETAGITTVGNTDYLNGGLFNAGRFLMPEEGFFTCGFTNRAGTTGWFGTANYHNPSSVVEVDLINLKPLRTLPLDFPGFSLGGAVIDRDEDFGYFMVTSRPGRIIKIDLDSLTLVDTLTLPPGEEFPSSGFIDPDGTNLFFGAGEIAAHVVRVDLATFQRTGGVSLPITEPFINTGVGDLTGEFGYFATSPQDLPPRLVKIDLQNMTRVGSLEILGAGRLRDGVLDSSGLLLYLCTSSEPAQLVRVDLEDFSEFRILPLPPGLNSAECLMINAAGTGALIGLQNGSVARVDLLGNMTFESSIPPAGPTVMQPAVAVRPRDSANIGYIAHLSQPGTITKNNIAANTRLGIMHLDSEQYLFTGVGDHDGKYAYYGMRHPVPKIIKIDLEKMERVSSISLPNDEQLIVCSAIDGQDRFAYFGTLGGGPDNRAEMIKVDLDTFTRVGAIQTPAGFPGIYAIALDEAGNRAWISSVDIPAGTRAAVALVDLNSFQQVGPWAQLTLGAAGTPQAAVFNPTDQNLYVATDDSPLKLFRVSGDLTTFAQFNAPAGQNQCNELVVHPADGNVYACNSQGAIIAFNISLESFTDAYGGSNLGAVHDGGFPSNTGPGFFLSEVFSGGDLMSQVNPDLANAPDPLVLQTISDLFLKGIAGGEAKGLVLSPEGDRAWYGIHDILSFVGRVNAFPRDLVKATRIQLAAPADVSSISFYNHAAVGPRRSGGERLSRDVGGLSSGAFHRPTGTAIYGTATFPGQLVKFDLGSLTQGATRTLEEGFDDLQCAFMEPDGLHACFGSFTSPGRIFRARTSDLETEGSLTLEPGDDNLIAAGVEPDGQFGYFASSSSPARIVKVQLDNLSRVDGLTLAEGEDLPKCLTVDPAGDFAYVGCGTFPGQVVKVRLSDFTREGALTLEPGEDSIRCGAIDPSGTFAYFGTDTLPARIVKVRLSDFVRVDALTLGPEESSAYAIDIDTDGQRLVVGLASIPVRVALIDLATFSRIGAASLRQNENSVTPSLAIDADGENAYLGLGTFPGRVVRVELSPKPLRLGIYGNSGMEKELLWESAPLPLSASEAWVQVDIAQGVPSTLLLPPNEYWLAWQVDASVKAASFITGATEGGLSLPWPPGPFPSPLVPGTPTGWTPTGERWSQYITFDFAPEPNYDIEPDPIDGVVDQLDLLEWLRRIREEGLAKGLLLDFARFWKDTGN